MPVHLMQLAAVAFRRMGVRLRRNVIAYAVCTVCGVAVLVLATWAGVLALLPIAGPVYAQLIVAGAYLLAALATVAWLQRVKSRAPAVVPMTFGVMPQQQHQFAQVAMIVEAVLLGYMLSRKTRRAGRK
jgi:hypothetical protein